MSEQYLQQRKTNLLAKANESDLDIEKTIERLAAVNQALGSGGSTDVSTLAKETTLTAVNNKLPALSGGAIPVDIEKGNLTADWRVIPASTTVIIPAGYVYLYLTVLSGTATINGLSFAVDDVVNLEISPIRKHPAVTIITAASSQVRVIGGY